MRALLFVYIYNASRSTMAETILNHAGQGRRKAFSAGEYASGQRPVLSMG